MFGHELRDKASPIFEGVTQFLMGQPETYTGFSRSTLSLSRCQCDGDSRFDLPATLHITPSNLPSCQVANFLRFRDYFFQGSGMSGAI